MASKVDVAYRYDTQGQQRAMNTSQKYVYNQRVTVSSDQPRHSQVLTIPSDYNSQQLPPSQRPIPRYVAELEPADAQPPPIYRPVQNQPTYNPPQPTYTTEPVQTYPPPQQAYQPKPQAQTAFTSGAPYVGQTDNRQLLTGPFADQPNKQLCIRVAAGIFVTIFLAAASVIFLKIFYDEF